MKDTSVNKLEKVILSLTTLALFSAGVKAYHNFISKNDIIKALAAGNEIKNEQTTESIPSDNFFAAEEISKKPLFGSNIKDKFEEATESEDEKIEEKQEESTAEITNPSVPEQNAAEKITDDIKSEIDNTLNEIEKTPTISEKTELAENLFRGVPDEIWKISGLVGFSALLGAGLIAAGTVAGVKKSRRHKAMVNDAKYFIGSEYVKKLNTLTATSKQINKYEEKITEYTNRANNANLKNRNKFLEKARILRTSDEYTELKKFKNQLIAQISSLVEKNITINPEKLNYLKNYAKLSKKIIVSPETQNKILSKALSKSVDKYISLVEKLEETTPNKKNKLSSAISSIKNNILNSLKKVNTNYVPSDKKLERKITRSIQKSSSLTGFNKVLLNEILNNQNNLFEKENLANIKNLATYLKSSKNNYNKYRTLLYKTLQADYYSSKNKVKKAEKIKDRVLDLLIELKNSDPRADLKYYGHINKIKDIPINPIRFISSNTKNKELNEFFDKITSSYINKDKFLHELTVNYDVSDKTYSFVCSFDNKEALKLVKAKFITAIPENAKNINIIEKTMNYNDAKTKTIKTDFNLAKNTSLYQEMVDQSEKLVFDFENLINNKANILNNDYISLSEENKEDFILPQTQSERTSLSNKNINRMLNLMRDDGRNL